MSDQHEVIAQVLGQVVELGPTVQEADLGAAVSRHVSNQPGRRPPPDPETAAALRALANDPSPVLGAGSSSLTVTVDFNALYATFGEPKIWEILGRLKELFG